MKETAVLIGLITPDLKTEQVYEYLDELSFLAKTAGAHPLRNFTQKLKHPDNATFLGKGKIEEVKEYVDKECVELIIFDDDLTPSQIRNIQKIFPECKILDRSNLILDIFASRAQTAQARTQVELAQYEYLLPRLTRMWTHLERQKGGIGMRGPGETQIETDRRIIKDKIALLKKKLEKIDKQSLTRRKGRVDMIRVALVGYTNAGKSTLMNKLSKSEIFAENKLFATLDTTVRKVVIQNLPFLLSDTVGFIRKLPHQLVESFKSTLDEVRESDLLLHIIDISNSSFEDQINIVNTTIADIGAENKPMILVFNKIDAYKFILKEEDDLTEFKKENRSLENLKDTWMNKIDGDSIFISALDKINFDDLKDLLYNRIKELHIKRYPYNNFLY
ncbi:MAG: GTPase HflX [Flavobacteriales bacterium]|jgi:GTPase|nr:GTPase HflX [Flavobacteriales bacterium]|tara:strand:- start:2360 stop:3529 length:1170 start_codon:yes stop_codon:yes gene_type:complete